MNSVKIGGMQITSVAKNELIDKLNSHIESCVIRKHISITNTEAMYFGSKYKKHFDYINSAFFSFCDGIGVELAAKIHGIEIRRYHGPDVMLDILNEGQKYGWTHYFLGGKEGVGEQLKQKMLEKYPKVNIVGVYSPPFRDLTDNEVDLMLKDINEKKPNFLWVSLGLPKQEKWIMKYLRNLNVNFAIGVGAAFDFHTENIKRAPYIYRKLGLEWLYRGFFEPRLIPRLIDSYKLFFSLIFSNKSRF